MTYNKETPDFHYFLDPSLFMFHHYGMLSFKQDINEFKACYKSIMLS